MGKTLMVLLYIAMVPLGLCAGGEDSWPEPVYFPQKQTTSEKADSSKPEKEEGKKWYWPFAEKASQKASDTPQTQSESKAGPKDPPASPYPLIRIPMSFQTSQGAIPSGIYLLQPSSCDQKSSSNQITNTCFSLTQRNKKLLVFETHTVSLPDANIAKEGTPSPLSKADPKKPEPLTATIRLSPDQKTLLIQVKQGQNTLESDWFTVFVDQRTILTY